MFYIDQGYVRYLAVTLRSISDTLDPSFRLKAHVIGTGLTPGDRRFVENSVPRGNIKLSWYEPDLSVFGSSFSTGISHLTHSTFYRLAFDQLTGGSLGKVLLLDSDIVVLDSLHKLFELPLDGKPLGACYNISNPYFGMQDAGMFSSEGARPLTPYFNAGVILVDMDAWRASDVFAKSLLLARKYAGQFRFHVLPTRVGMVRK